MHTYVAKIHVHMNKLKKHKDKQNRIKTRGSLDRAMKQREIIIIKIRSCI
jgi:hypothetical protein